MNFKSTFWKSIISLISGIVVNYLLVKSVNMICNCVIGDTVCNCPQPQWIEFAFDPVPVIISLAAIVLVYVIWSFIQKK